MINCGIGSQSFRGTLWEGVQPMRTTKYSGFEPGTYGILKKIPKNLLKNVNCKRDGDVDDVVT